MILMTETIRKTVTIQPEGRMVIPDEIREILNIKNQKAFCQIEVYGKDKALITILTRWNPDHRNPGQDRVKTQ